MPACLPKIPFLLMAWGCPDPCHGPLNRRYGPRLWGLSMNCGHEGPRRATGVSGRSQCLEEAIACLGDPAMRIHTIGHQEPICLVHRPCPSAPAQGWGRQQMVSMGDTKPSEPRHRPCRSASSPPYKVEPAGMSATIPSSCSMHQWTDGPFRSAISYVAVPPGRFQGRGRGRPPDPP